MSRVWEVEKLMGHRLWVGTWKKSNRGGRGGGKMGMEGGG